MQNINEKILNYIEKNSRIDLKELATILGENENEVINALQDMEEKHIICGYHTLINWDKAGIDKVTAMIEVRVTPQRGMGFDKVAKHIYNYPEVTSVYLISGGFDFMVIIEGRTLKEVAEFVSSKLAPLESVLSTKTNFILKLYKEHGTIMSEDRIDERMKMSL
jgi:DNA-binding Lrp family transcriptional regulator